MRIENLLWKEPFLDKIVDKHGVLESEVEDVMFDEPHIRFAEKGHVAGEHVYAAYGQTESGRYLIIFFIDKGRGLALPISARDMTTAERKYFNEQI